MKGNRLREKQEQHHQGDTKWTQCIDLSGDVHDKDVDIGDIGAVQVDNYDGEEDFDDVTDFRTIVVDSDDDCMVYDVVDVDTNEKLVNAVATNDNKTVKVVRVEEPDEESEYDLFTAEEAEAELRIPAYQIALNKLNSQGLPVELNYPKNSSKPPNISSHQNHHDEFKTSKRVPAKPNGSKSVLLDLLNKPLGATSSLIPFSDSQWAHEMPNESEATKHNEGYQLLKMKPRSTKIAFADSSTIQPRTAESEQIQPNCAQSTFSGSTTQPRTDGSEHVKPKCTQSTLSGSTTQPRTAGSEHVKHKCAQSTLSGSTTQPRSAGSDQIQPKCTQSTLTSSTIQPRTAWSELIQPRSTHFLQNVPWCAQSPPDQPPTNLIHQSVKHSHCHSHRRKSIEDSSEDVVLLEGVTEGQERKRSIYQISDCSSLVDSISLRPCSVVLSRIDEVGGQNWNRCRKSEEKTATAATSRGTGKPDADTQLGYTDLQQNRQTTVVTPILHFIGNRETSGVKSKSQRDKKESFYLICRRKRFKFHRVFHTWAPKKILFCGHCNQDFRFVSYLREHFRNVHREHYKYSCNICCSEIQPEKLLFHLQKHKSLGYQCGVCMKNFTEVGELHTHLKKHEKKIIYKCGICMVKFQTRKKLKKHFYCHFPGFFRCEICNQRFKGHHNLTRHNNREHGQVLVQRSTSTQTEGLDSPDRRIELEEPDHDKMEDPPSGNEIGSGPNDKRIDVKTKLGKTLETPNHDEMVATQMMEEMGDGPYDQRDVICDILLEGVSNHAMADAHKSKELQDGQNEEQFDVSCDLLKLKDANRDEVVDASNDNQIRASHDLKWVMHQTIKHL